MIEMTLFTDTTRAKEEGEIHGVDYSFVSRIEFETMVEDGR